MSTQASTRATRAVADLGDLFPQAEVSLRRGRVRSGGSYDAVPSRAPRVLVPAQNRRAAATALLRVNQGTSRVQRVAQAGLWLWYRSGLPERLPRDQVLVGEAGSGEASLVDVLSEHFGTAVDVALGVGAQRANQKPVLQVFDGRGQCLAFAKVGLSPLAQDLVAAEHDALTRLAHGRHTTFDQPRVLALLEWDDLPVLVLSPMPTPWLRRGSADALPVAPMLEVAEFAGLVPHLAGDLSFFRPDPADGDGTLAERYHRALEAVADRYGDVEVTVGTWHGDWGPWNMAWTRGLLHLWDWERFATGAPLGLDALHFRLQPRLRRLDTAVTADELLAAARDAVRPLPVPPAQVPAVLVAYLSAITRRYVRDAGTEHGSVLLPHVERMLGLIEAFALAERGRTGGSS